MTESTCLESMYRFCRAVVRVFAEVYLRQPNVVDTVRLLSISDCMHLVCYNLIRLLFITLLGHGARRHYEMS
jgi:hypothetical protein